MPVPLMSPEALAGFRDLQSPEDPHFVREFLKTVLSAFPPRLEGIKRAIAAADYVALAAEAHALKSSCANAEIRVMTTACAELEALGRAASLDGASERNRQLCELYEQLRAEIHALPEFAGSP